jgi:hypothetical protein
MNTPALSVSTLLCHRDVAMGLRCFRSLADYSEEPVAFVIHDDGSLDDEDRSLLLDVSRSGIQVARIISRRDADAVIRDRLAAYPYCAALRARQAYGLKLFDVPFLSDAPVVRYMDSDVLFLQPLRGLFSMRDDQDCIFMQDHQNAYALRPWHLLAPGMRIPQKINSGLFALRTKIMDLDRTEWLLAKDLPVFHKLPWFEQTCWAWLASRHAGHVWDGRQIQVIEATTVFDDSLVAAHFVTPSRGRLGEFPATAPRSARAPVDVRQHAMKPLNPAAYMAEMVLRSIRRRLP